RARRSAPMSGVKLWRQRCRRLGGDTAGRLRRALRRLLLGRDEAQRANEYRHFTRVLRANERALERYQPRVGSCRVTFFAATARPAALYEEFACLTGCEIEVLPVPGDHLSMLEPPHVNTLAAALKLLA
ncbi:MAG: hypothetical protein ABIV06_10365, partial [Thermoanaerobaculia bacterium]